jgi:hypothetical protein
MVALVGFCSLSGCGTTGPELVTQGFIPNFTFVWRDRADFGHQYAFFPSATSVESGRFEDGSNEQLNGRFSDITGTFSGRALTFRVARASGPIDVTGRFLTDDTIELRWGTTVITIERFQP